MHCLYSSVNKRVKYSLLAAISQTFTVENTHLQTVKHTDISYQQQMKCIKFHTDCSLEVQNQTRNYKTVKYL